MCFIDKLEFNTNMCEILGVLVSGCRSVAGAGGTPAVALSAAESSGQPTYARTGTGETSAAPG